MFTGIIEEIGELVSIEKEKSNIHFTLKAEMSQDLKVDQSLSHNGVCLTIVNVSENSYSVTAINETILKTNLKNLKVSIFL